MRKFLLSLGAATVMPRWMWYLLIAAAITVAALQWQTDARLRARARVTEANRCDIDTNAERAALVENALMRAGTLAPESVLAARERLSPVAQCRVMHAGELSAAATCGESACQR